MTKKELTSWEIKPKYRRIKMDESRLYDKKCPACGLLEMTGKWSWSKLKYTIFRCSSTECNYGNTKNNNE